MLDLSRNIEQMLRGGKEGTMFPSPLYSRPKMSRMLLVLMIVERRLKTTLLDGAWLSVVLPADIDKLRPLDPPLIVVLVESTSASVLLAMSLVASDDLSSPTMTSTMPG